MATTNDTRVINTGKGRESGADRRRRRRRTDGGRKSECYYVLTSSPCVTQLQLSRDIFRSQSNKKTSREEEKKHKIDIVMQFVACSQTNNYRQVNEDRSSPGSSFPISRGRTFFEFFFYRRADFGRTNRRLRQILGRW